MAINKPINFPKPEQKALEVIAQSGFTCPPIDLEYLVDKCWSNVKISVESLDGDGYFIDLGQLGAEIVVNNGNYEFRRRFTIAHEIGHLVFQNASKNLSSLNNLPNEFIEKWCDKFAASLLMPKTWIQNDLDQMFRNDKFDIMLYGPNKYQVSHQAFRRRLRDLSRISFFEIFNKNGQLIIDDSKSFRNIKVSKERIDIMLRNVCSNANCIPNQWIKNSAEGLVAIQKQIHRNNEDRRFLCIIPQKEFRFQIDSMKIVSLIDINKDITESDTTNRNLNQLSFWNIFST